MEGFVKRIFTLQLYYVKILSRCGRPSHACRQVEQFVSQYVSITETLAGSAVAERMVQAPGVVTESADFTPLVTALQETMQAYPDILGMGFGSMAEDYMYDQNGQWYDIRHGL